jgi:hypothetical protein
VQERMMWWRWHGDGKGRRPWDTTNTQDPKRL